jgi:hypothetical protein
MVKPPTLSLEKIKGKNYMQDPSSSAFGRFVFLMNAIIVKNGLSVS